MTRSRVRPLTINSVKSPGLGGASCCSDSATATGTSLSPSLFASLAAIGTSCTRGAGAVSANSGGSSTGSFRPPEATHPEQIKMTSKGSANEAPRGARAKELKNAETGSRNNIMTIILANGASYDSKSASCIADYHSRCAWQSQNGSKGSRPYQLLGGPIDLLTLRTQHHDARLAAFVHADADARAPLCVRNHQLCLLIFIGERDPLHPLAALERTRIRLAIEDIESRAPVCAVDTLLFPYPDAISQLIGVVKCHGRNVVVAQFRHCDAAGLLALHIQE